jgi:hypothetical protein
VRDLAGKLCFGIIYASFHGINQAPEHLAADYLPLALARL